MSVPIAVWIAAGLGAAGIKLYMDMRDVKQIVENSQARYEDEKYNYYQTQKALLPLLLLAGNLKLEIWQSFERMADALEQIDNLPRQLKYMNFETFRMGKPEREALRETAKVVNTILKGGMADVGSGVLTALALYGATMTHKFDENDVNNLPGFPQCDKGTTILEALSTHQIKVPAAGNVAEASVLNAILDVPAVIQDFGVDKLSKNDKNAAMKLKDKIDKHSMQLADVVGKMQRIHITIERLLNYVQKLNDEYLVQMEKVEQTLLEKKDYEKFKPEEKTALVYAAFLVKTLKAMTRIDILLKRGNLYVFNTMDIREVIDQAKVLFPEEDLTPGNKA
ncbi:MAG: hypothetical protein GX451_08210 [Acholeplasmataceae bacterium]|nr:hypothetical protein [Acholeplasmataceae bacterium]